MTQKNSLRSQVASATVAALALAVGGSPAWAITIKDLGYEYWHLQEGAEQTSVGQISMFEATIDEDTLEIIPGAALGTCSGSVIGDQYFITAAHCTFDAGLIDLEINGQTYTGAEWYVPTGYTGEELGTYDISIIKIDGTFDSSIPRLRYNGMNGSTPLNPSGQDVEIVGFGTFGTGEQGVQFPAGTRRSAFNTLDVDPLSEFSEPGFNPLYYDFDPPQDSIFFDFGPDFDWETEGQLVLESSGAPGDSGGPVLFEGTNIIAGLTSFGFGFAPSLAPFTTIGGSTNVADWSDWIDTILADGLPADTAVGTPGEAISSVDEAEDAAEAAAEILLDQLVNRYGSQITVYGEAGSGLFWGRAGLTSQPTGNEIAYIAGDLDRDGDVDDTDLGILLAHWQANTYNWQEGNLTYDAIVDDLDLGVMLANWTGEISQATLDQIAAVTGLTTPEPTSLALLTLAGLGLLRRRPSRG